jgi:hypothetical protein
MKKTIFFFIFFIFIGSAVADRVIIFNFNYDHGTITLKEQMIKEGYYPDRKIQPEEGYKCQLKNDAGRNFYSMKFDLPVNVFTDTLSNGNTVGGVVILNQTDFSFVVPYIAESKDLVCYNKRGYETVREPIVHPLMSAEQKDYNLIYFAILLLITLLIITYFKKKNNHL